MKTIYNVSQKGHTASICGETVSLQTAKNSDIWRLYLDDGVYREIPVLSSMQNNAVIQHVEGETIITYNSLVAENQVTYNIVLEVHITHKSDGSYFHAVITNNDKVRVNEAQLPFIELDDTNCNPKDEVLFVPDGLGKRIPNIREYISRCYHTEYMAADYKNIWQIFTYPGLSMSWLGIQFGKYHLHMARLDDKFRICSLCVGTSPRGEDLRLALTVSHYPLAVENERIVTPSVLVSLYEGDWRIGAAAYRKWADNWYTPKDKPLWVNKMTGWQRIILKHQYGEIFYKFEDLPRLYSEGAKYGINALFVYGWWKGCFDNNYPEYEVDDALGGAEALSNAIAAVQSMGGNVILYSNGKLIDIKTEYYATKGKDICKTDIDLNEYREHYRFSNNGTVLRNFGYKSFVTACHATDEWKDKLIDITNTMLSFRPDSVFYDQMAGAMSGLCFDACHKHKRRADEEAVYRHENIDAICKQLKNGEAIGSEHIVDAFSYRFDFIHSCNWGAWLAPYTYPYLYRAVFPDTIMTNRYLHDERKDFKDQLNYAFVMGLIFDVSIYRCRKNTIADMLGFAAHVKYLIDIKSEYKRFFQEGRFVSKRDYALPEGIIMAEYEHGDEVLFVFANTSEQHKTFEIENTSVSVNAHDVSCVITKK